MAKKRHAKQWRRLKRWAVKHKAPVTLLLGVAVIVGGYMVYDSGKRQRVDQQSYEPLLRVIAEAESKGNYNAYFGNASNRAVRFTDMTIQQVLDWQAAYVANGNPSSAVGRYQFLNTTLEGLVDEYNIERTAPFDEAMQDTLASYLLERRGSEAYVNQEITKHDFAASLAKEWASLPMVVGDAPEKSYYESDGLNKALVKPKEVLGAISQVQAK